MATSVEVKNTGLSGPVTFGAGLLLFALAPIIRGGNRQIAMIGLEWLSILILWLVALTWLKKADPEDAFPADETLPLREWVLVASPLFAALLQLTPLPIALWSTLPGHGLYGQLLRPEWLALSVTPDATRASLMAGIPLVAAFLVARTSSEKQIALLPPVLVLIAFVQAVWGLLQAGPFKSLYFGAEFAGSLIGSFANSNHFANYIAMTLPLAVFVVWRSASHRRAEAHPRPQLAAVFWLVVLLVLVTTVLASGSRTGAVIGMMVTFFALLLALSAVSKTSRKWYGLGAVVLVVAGLVVVGVNTLVVRFDADRLGVDSNFRWMLVASSWQAALAFWPTGSGAGSYSAVFPAFEVPGVRGFAEHAHNDYVELLIEFGLLFVLVAALVARLAVRQAWSLWRHITHDGRGVDVAPLQLFCGLGLLAILLHSWVDFNLRIPANAILCACLFGAFLRPVRRGNKSPANG